MLDKRVPVLLEEPRMSDKSAALAIQTQGSPITLKGSTRGLEIRVVSGEPLETIVREIASHLEQAPEFFSGGDVTIRFDDHPPKGFLGPIEEVTARYDLRIVSVCGPQAPEVEDELRKPESASAVEPVRAVGSEPLPSPPRAQPTSAPHAKPPNSDSGNPPKLIVGPVRSGCVLEVGGHLIVLGDVNPGAEVRAAGSIVVLGRLRGIAHAAAEGGAGFILALELEPQQLRVGDLLARAGDSEDKPEKAEIAYAKDGKILVEGYAGRLPWGIATAKF